MADDLTLKVNGTALSGWTSVRVTRGIERMPSDFEIALTDRFPDEASLVVAQPGDRCEVLLGADVVITGYVNRLQASIDKQSHTIRLSGRSLSQDLVDCSAEWPGGQIAGSNALQIAQKLSAPYGIKASATVDPGPVVPQFNLMIGESAYDIIERVCRYAGLIVYDKPDGSIVLAQAGTKKAASGFAQGQNAESATFQWIDEGQFQTYSVFGLSVNTHFDAGFLNQPLGVATDPNVKRRRLKYFVAESGSAGHDISLKRAKWQAARNLGRAWTLNVRADSWRDKAGKLWEPNTLATVSFPSIRLTAKELCIGSVTFRRDERGTAAELTLMPRDAFLPEPVNLLPILRDAVPASQVR